MNPPVPNQFRNPVLPGFHPDPTICRVGDDYWLATSSFTYFPGVPLFHSKDLVHWRPVGHALTRLSQFPSAPQGHSEGIFAATLRHDGRRFYLITTNVGNGGNFIITADRVEGPWSDPHYLEDAPGIDPSLYFEDGRAWVCGTAEVPEGGRYFGDNEIWLREIHPETLAWKGPRVGLWRGALRNAIWAEGPHLYRKDDWYYLLISEGGTGHHHSLTVARSRSVLGPFEGNPGNPILTHRHLGQAYPVTNPGHADLFEVPGDGWWMVLLASRPHHGGGSNRGRETFLVPVSWEDDWPVVSPGTGKVEEWYRRPALPWTSWPQPADRGRFDSFDAAELGDEWVFLRAPDSAVHSLSDRPGWLRLLGRGDGPGSRATQAWVGRRILHECWNLTAKGEILDAVPAARAGLSVIQSDDFHLRLEWGWNGHEQEVRAVARVAGIETILGRVAGWPSFLEIECEGHTYRLRVGSDGLHWSTVVEGLDGSFLTTERANGFVGCLAGPFAVGGRADFDWVDYRGMD